VDGTPALIVALIEDHRRIEAAVARTSECLIAARLNPSDATLEQALASVKGLQRSLEDDIALHIEKEEQLLFPAVRTAMADLSGLLDDMIAEHDEVRERRAKLGQTLERLDDDHSFLHHTATQLAGETAPSTVAIAPPALDRLDDAVRQLDWLLQGHFTGEEDGVFLPAEELLTVETFEELNRRAMALEAAWQKGRTTPAHVGAEAREAQLLPALPVFPVPAGLPAEIDWRLRVGGLVRSALALDQRALRSLPPATLSADFSCEEGWRAPGLRWRGVAVRSILELAGVQPEARFLVVGSVDFVTVLPLSSLAEQAPLLAYELDGEPLSRAHGGPLRLVASEAACYQSIKWVDRLELTAEPVEETAERIALQRLGRR